MFPLSEKTFKMLVLKHNQRSEVYFPLLVSCWETRMKMDFVQVTIPLCALQLHSNIETGDAFTLPKMQKATAASKLNPINYK